MKETEGIPTVPYARLGAKRRRASPIILFAFTTAHMAMLGGWILMIAPVKQERGILVSKGLDGLSRLSLNWASGAAFEWGAIACSLIGLLGIWLHMRNKRYAQRTLLSWLGASMVVCVLNMGAYLILANKSPLTFQNLAGLTQCSYVFGSEVVVESILKTLPAWVVGIYLAFALGSERRNSTF